MATTCRLARSRIVVPLTWQLLDGVEATPDEARRRLVEDLGSAVWEHEEEGEEPVAGVTELVAGVRMLLGFRGDRSAWSASRLRLKRGLLEATLGRQRQVALVDPTSDAEDDLATVDRVKVVFFPLGAGAMLLDLSWCAEGWPLTRVTRAVYRARHMVHDNVLDGAHGVWRLAASDEGCVSLSHLVATLLRDASRVEVKVQQTRFALHDTVVVLSSPPKDDEVGEELFRLRRGYDRTYVAPPGGVVPPDQLLRPRGNRWVGVSREGSASVSWYEETASFDVAFEGEIWPSRFQGVYSELALLVRAEQMILGRLGRALGERVHRLRAATLDQESADDAYLARHALHRFAQEAAHYTLVMSYDDSGGLSDYAAFFNACRAAYGVGTQRDELREEIREALALVEASHALTEEHARQDLEDRRAVEQGWLGFLAALFLPTSIITSVYGMAEVHGLPPISFDGLLALAVASTGVMFMVLRASVKARVGRLARARRETRLRAVEIADSEVRGLLSPDRKS